MVKRQVSRPLSAFSSPLSILMAADFPRIDWFASWSTVVPSGTTTTRSSSASATRKATACGSRPLGRTSRCPSRGMARAQTEENQQRPSACLRHILRGDAPLVTFLDGNGIFVRGSSSCSNTKLYKVHKCSTFSQTEKSKILLGRQKKRGTYSRWMDRHATRGASVLAPAVRLRYRYTRKPRHSSLLLPFLWRTDMTTYFLSLRQVHGGSDETIPRCSPPGQGVPRGGD